MRKNFLGVLFVILAGGIFLFSRELRAEEPLSVVITEIGAYEQQGFEWIEILNVSESAVDLSGWTFWENNRTYNLVLVQGDDSLLEPREYAIITQNDNNFLAAYPHVTSTIFDSINWQTLNESGEEIGLRDAQNNIIEQFAYVAAPDFSLERINPKRKEYSEENWKEHPDSNSVGTQNYWHEEDDVVPEPEEPGTSEENVAPTAVITAPTSTTIHEHVTFDASSSEDDGTIVSYSWNFGDGVTSSEQIAAHSFMTTGTFSVSLTIADDFSATSTAIHHIAVFASSSPEKEEQGKEEAAVQIAPGDIVINEFMPNPASGHEWIELFNTTERSISLEGWSLHDGAGAIASLTDTIAPFGFVTIDLPTNKLNNAGDRIFLKHAEDEPIDAITYGNWNDGDMQDNAPAPLSGNSLARADDGEDSDDDVTDIEETTTPTKGGPNIITLPPVAQTSPSHHQHASQPEEINVSYNSSDIVINEFVSDPSGDDEEFIELYNNTYSTINLYNWRVEDGSGTKTVLSGTILPQEFFVIQKPKGALNNAGDLIALFDASGTEIDRVVYGNWAADTIESNAPAASDPMSTARRLDGKDTNNHAADFTLTRTVTKGAKNIITKENTAPIISAAIPTSTLVREVISLDASKTIDPDGDELSFVWNLENANIKTGRTVSHLFEHIGTFRITLTVTDSAGNESVLKKEIIVTDGEDFVGGSPERSLDGLVISEIFPNPPGVDNGEFIELHNASAFTIDLSGLFLDDSEGGSKPYQIPDGQMIQPGEYLELYQTETKLSFNNTADAARILLADGSVFSSIPYSGAKEGVSFARNVNNEWSWTNTPTPGEENSFSVIVAKAATKTSTTSKTKTNASKTATATTISHARTLGAGSLVRLTGTVTALPGTLGTQIFYIADDTGGIQVYSHKKDFPNLLLFDQVEITGELSESGNEMRIKTTDRSAIRIVGHANYEPVPLELEFIEEAYEGVLVLAQGEVTEIKSSSIYIDDGSTEGLVYIKKTTGIERLDLKPGDHISVTGILGQTKNGYRILPRSAADITKIAAPSEPVLQTEEESLPPSSSIAETYLTATAGGLTSILFGLLAKNHGPRAANRVRQTSAAAIAKLRRTK